MLDDAVSDFVLLIQIMLDIVGSVKTCLSTAKPVMTLSELRSGNNCWKVN